MRNQIQSNFNLPQQVQVELDVFPSNGGKINISTISPDSYPWNGIYFDGVPIQIEALALPGYQFSHWESNGLISDTLNPVFNDTLTTSNINFVAHFASSSNVIEHLDGSINIYPNPTSSKLNVIVNKQIGHIKSIQAFDLIGQNLVLDIIQRGNHEFLIDTWNLSPGCYIIQMTNQEGKSYHARFLKQ
jgi:hypothetical protein